VIILNYFNAATDSNFKGNMIELNIQLSLKSTLLLLNINSHH